MSKYKEIKGFKVQTLASDTAATKFLGATWASGGSLPEGRSSAMGFGTQTASLFGSGYNGTNYLNTTFEYDGSSWTAGGDLTASAGQARAGHGILTAGGAVAGYKTSGNAVINNYEQYDGSSFSEQADLNTARQTLSATGSTTAALAVGGTTSVGPGSTQTGLTNVESYNGSSWTETTENNTGRKQGTSFSGGPAPTMIFIGGASGSTVYANTETYNGSAWTETTDLNTARFAFAGAGQAQTDGLVFGGSTPSNTAVTENWDGTTWTELANLSTSRAGLVGSGTGAASALATGGYSTTYVSASEEFTAPADFTKINLGQVYYNSGSNAFKVTIKDATTGTWSSGGNLNTGRSALMGAGTNTAGLAFGGYNPFRAQTESYDGSSWTEVNDLNTARYGICGASFGPYTATLAYGGNVAGFNPTVNTESWNGSSWTEVNNLNSGRYDMSSIGIQTSAIAAGGTDGPSTKTLNELWDGTSWTESGDLNTARYNFGSFGASNTSGLVFGGVPFTGSPPNGMPATEHWDGSSWTEVNNLNTGRAANRGAGSFSSGLSYGGNPSTPNNVLTEFWNGTSWTEIADLATARISTSGSGSSAAAFAAGGESDLQNTEEFTAGTGNTTITVS